MSLLKFDEDKRIEPYISAFAFLSISLSGSTLAQLGTQKGTFYVFTVHISAGDRVTLPTSRNDGGITKKDIKNETKRKVSTKYSQLSIRSN